MRNMFEHQMDVTAKVMDLQLQRQNLVTGNIANVNTPGYKARHLEFEEKLQDVLDQNALGRMTRTSEKHMPSTFNVNGFSGDSLQDFRAREIYGTDKVNLEKEMNSIAKTTLQYNALASVIKKNFSGLSKVIQEGSK